MNHTFYQPRNNCQHEKWKQIRDCTCPDSAVRESADMCLLLQVQAGGDPSASGAGGGGMLDSGFHRGAHTHARLEQPEAPPAERLHQL